MFKELFRAIKVTLILAVILCGAYPLLVWALSTVIFHDQATGGIVYRDGKPVGAKLIGQGFARPVYFHGRPSAAGQSGYDAANSSGSNLGPTNKKLAERVEGDMNRLLKENPGLRKGSVPVDLLTTSGSGLDPAISPEAAEVQVERVAKARSLPVDRIRELVSSHTTGPQWGVFGESAVDLLTLNLHLDAIAAGNGK